MRQLMIWYLLVGTLCLLAVVWAQRAQDAAEARRQGQVQRAQLTHRQIRELHERQARADVPQVATVADDPLRRLRQSLEDAGLGDSVFGGLQRLGDRPLAEAGLVVRTVRIRLVSVSPGELGRFCAAWLVADCPWRIIDCRLSQPVASAMPSNRFTVNLTLQAHVVSAVVL